MLDDTLLTSFMSTFYGYGTYAAPYWFVGMEECGGGSLAAAEGRITQWQNRGRKELEDPRGNADALALSASPWFRPYPKLQSTWKQLIRMTLIAQGHFPYNNQLRYYQRDHLGRTGNDGETCLLELLPLPSPSTKDWFYKDYTTIPYLQTRELYKEHLAPTRAAHLKQRVADHKPRAVVFYSANWWYKQYWQEIAGAPFERKTISGGDVLQATTPTTTFVIAKHPITVGITTRYFEEVGMLLQQPG